MKKMIFATLMAVLMVGCGEYTSTKTTTIDNSTDNSVTNSGNTTTVTDANATVGEADNADTNTTDDAGIPEIDGYSRGVIVLECSDPGNVHGMSVYKCLKPNTHVGAVSTAGTLTETDRYKTDDRFVMDFTITGISEGDTVTVQGLVDWGDANASAIPFATDTCKVGE